MALRGGLVRVLLLRISVYQTYVCTHYEINGSKFYISNAYIGFIFVLKYKVFYRIPTCFAELDGVKMYPLISCPAYIHRYSVLWKDFDLELYTIVIESLTN